jgi:hypothetical protein
MKGNVTELVVVLESNLTRPCPTSGLFSHVNRALVSFLTLEVGRQKCYLESFQLAQNSEESKLSSVTLLSQCPQL